MNSVRFRVTAVSVSSAAVAAVSVAAAAVAVVAGAAVERTMCFTVSFNAGEPTPLAAGANRDPERGVRVPSASRECGASRHDGNLVVDG